jgi:hypothetical protein
MDDELRILHEAMVVKERLKVLAELQSTYWEELLARGFDQGVAEQLMMEWSRHAYGMTFRAMPEPSLDSELDELLGAAPAAPSVSDTPPDGAQPPRPPRSLGDPSSVPPGEPWLQLVQDTESDDDASEIGPDADAGADAGADADSGDQRAA